MKKLIAELPTLTAPKEQEELIIYLAAAKEAINAVLMTDREGKQVPVYFVSRALRGPEINYTPMEKLVLALLSASKRLKIYFQAHTIVVITDQPIKQLLSNGSGAGLILTNTEGAEFTYAMRFRFEATNNKAEYEALIASLRIAEQMGVKNLQAHVDSRLIANQVNGSYVAKESGMIQYLNKVLVEELKEESINEKEILAVVEEEGNTWMTPICEYLTKEILPADKKKARAVPRSCNMHSGPRFVVAKAIRTGYYWPTMHMDPRKLIRECNDCQVHRPVPRNPQQNLTPITSPWPFYKWGIDIARPFPKGPGKVKFLIIAVDYFTKWIEAKPVATIIGNQVKKFIWDNIVYRFGLPGEIVSDNGK
ncbi:reverse transcriptase domain-containing protein [Tanacetum coccineum]|uniref:Reverse transcriptase domain-containing protein n=1 Tax=Tanacetum coccineum TaxID=301880 RepID=A0ABQ5GDW8_9ASTR